MYALAFLAGLSISVFNPLISTFMEERNIGNFWIGLISTIYFLTIALSSPIAEKGLRKIGVSRTIQFGLITAGLITPLFVLTETLSFWFLIRILMAAGIAFVMIGGQTGLNSLNTEKNKAATNGIYSLSMAVGFGMGPIIAPPIYDKISPEAAFIMGGILTLSALVFVHMGIPRGLETPAPKHRAPVWRKIRIPAHTVFSYGFLEAGLFCIFPVFLLRQDYVNNDVEKMGWAISILMAGSLLSIVPVTMAADRVGKMKMLLVCIVVGLFAGLGMVLSESYKVFMIFSLIGGMGFGPVFPLSLSVVAETLSREEFPSGSALFTAMFSFGCAAGPMLTAIAMDVLGNQHFFTLTIILFITVIVHIMLGAEKKEELRISGEVKMNVSRRRFIKYSGATVAGLALGTYGAGKLNPVDYDDPAYQYWRQMNPGAMNDGEYIVMCGILAASPHNTQPWKFKILRDRIEIFAEKTRSLGAADPELKLLTQGVGCAMENMTVAARTIGYGGVWLDVVADTGFDASGHCGTLYLDGKGNPGKDERFDAIFSRQTNRGKYDTQFKIPGAFTNALAGECEFPGISIAWFDKPEDIERMAEITIESVRVFLNNDDMVNDANKWFRMKRQDYEAKRDGISIFPTPAPFFIKHLYQWGMSRQDLETEAVKQGELDHIKNTVPATPLWGMIWADKKSHAGRIYGGQMLEKVYLEAARQGYGICPLSYPSDIIKTENWLKRMVGAGRDSEVLSVFRVGKADRLEKSVRLDLKKVII